MNNKLLAELQQNPRLRIGLAAITAIVWLNQILDSREQISDARLQLQQAERKLQRLKQDQTQTNWLERLQQAKSLDLELNLRTWESPSFGVAQATFNEWLTRQAATAGLSTPKINMAEMESKDKKAAANTDTHTLPEGMWRVRAKVEASFQATSALHFLQKLSEVEQRSYVESLNIRMFPTPQLELEVSGLSRKKAEQPPAEQDARN